VSDEEFARLPALSGAPVAERWPVVGAHVSNETALTPDIWHVTLMSDAFAMLPEVAERLEPFLSQAGELLALGVEPLGLDLLALNVLAPLDVHAVIDTSASDADREAEIATYVDLLPAEDHRQMVESMRAGELWPVLYPVFKPDALDRAPTFFKIDRLSGAIFLLDLDDESDTLLRRIQALGITGLVFDKIWSSASGPEEVNLFRP